MRTGRSARATEERGNRALADARHSSPKIKRPGAALCGPGRFIGNRKFPRELFQGSRRGSRFRIGADGAGNAGSGRNAEALIGENLLERGEQQEHVSLP